jgi:hypothetical protein
MHAALRHSFTINKSKTKPYSVPAQGVRLFVL